MFHTIILTAVDNQINAKLKLQVQPEQVILARSTSRGNTLSRQSYDVKACNTHARARHRDPNSELALLGLETRDYHMVELI